MIVSGVQQSDSVIRIHLSFLFQTLFPFRLLQSIEQSSPCYTVGPYLFIGYARSCTMRASLVVAWRLSWPVSWGILVHWPGIEPCVPWIGRWVLYHWTILGVPIYFKYSSLYMPILSSQSILPPTPYALMDGKEPTSHQLIYSRSEKETPEGEYYLGAIWLYSM